MRGIAMGKKAITEDSIIKIDKSMQGYRVHAFFEDITGKTVSGWEMKPWLAAHEGKTIKEAVPFFLELSKRKNIKERLSEERFNFISEADKSFITAFDKKIEKLGYDFGDGVGEGHCWGRYMIIYSKTGTKSKSVIARFFIRENGVVILRLFFNNIDKHRSYIENAPEHIKKVFTNDRGNCSCNPRNENCRFRKTYTLDGRQIEKCSWIVFEFKKPTLERLPHYMELLEEFYPNKKPKLS